MPCVVFSGVWSYSPSSLSHHNQSCSVSMMNRHQEMNGLISDVMDLVKEFSALSPCGTLEWAWTILHFKWNFSGILRDRTSLHMGLKKYSYIYNIFKFIVVAVNSIMNIAVIVLHYLFNHCIFFLFGSFLVSRCKTIRYFHQCLLFKLQKQKLF